MDSIDVQLCSDKLINKLEMSDEDSAQDSFIKMIRPALAVKAVAGEV